jgi:hypothetical protein
MGKSVFCIADSESQAERIVSDLKRNGFHNGDISVLFPDRTGAKDFGHSVRTKASEGAISGIIAAAIIGGTAGWLVGVGHWAFPQAGAIAAAGPVVAALASAAIFGIVGGVAGAFLGHGIPEIVARRYEGKIAHGNILISVHADTGAMARQAKRILQNAGCAEASIAAEAKAPQPRLCPT